MWVVLSRTQKYFFFFLFFLNPPNFFYSTKKKFFFLTLHTNLWITQTFLTRFPKFKEKKWTFKMAYTYLLFDLTYYKVWWGKHGKFNFLSHFLVCFLSFNKNYRTSANILKDSFSWKEINTSFDQIGQILP